MLNVVILTECRKDTGFGHVARCMALYEAFEDYGCSPLLVINVDRSIRRKLLGKKVIFSDWINAGIKEIANNDYQAVIVDSYLADKNAYSFLSGKFSTAVFLDDNIRIRYPKGIVMNGAILAEEMNYPPDPEITYLTGIQYAPLRRAFWEVSPKKVSYKIEKVLITMGESNTGTLVLDIAELLQSKYPSLSLVLLLGENFRHKRQVKSMHSRNVEFVYGADSVKVKHIMEQADLAVSAAGQTLYELARLGVPAVAVQLANNQQYNVKGWQKAGFVEFAGMWGDTDLLVKIVKCMKRLSDPKERNLRSAAGQKYVDGHGAKRVVKSVIYQHFDENMNIRKVIMKDLTRIYELSNDDTVRKSSFHPQKIEFTQHQEWFYQKLKNGNSLFLIAEIHKQLVAQVRFEVKEDALISISIAKQFRHMGIGALVMKKAFQALRSVYPYIKNVVALVKDDNIISKKYFEKCNYIFRRTLSVNGAKAVEYHYLLK